MNPEFACSIDWGIFAAWVGALATVGLVLAAYIGFGQWKKQFTKRRDHDLALKLLRKLDDSNRELDALRAPVAIITDGDVPIAPSSYEDEQRDWDHRKMSARYRARQQHYLTTANERIDAVHEAMLIWDDCGQELQDLADELSEKETQVFVEAQKYVDNLHPNTEEEAKIDKDILYARADRDVKDPFADDPFAKEYFDIVLRIRALLQPKLRLK